MIGRLSGGEKRRLYLLKILMEAPNVLILDEPTNDLDISTMMILEDYLDSFKGIVITVSHDRYFLNRIVKRIFAYEGDGNIKQYEGNYDDYLMKRSSVVKDTASEKVQKTGSEKTNVKPRSAKLKMTYNEQKEFETIDSDIAILESKIEELEADMEKYSTDFVKLNECAKEKDEAEKQLEAKMDRWMYLNDLNEKILNQ